MSSRSASPRLPTFGIRDLTGPSNPPGLISISRRQYESTIRSQPDARLLYLDDDDGELITVGSSLELSQRLQEPVLKYSRGNFSEAYNPLDGKLVHVFDIKHSNGSLAEWKDHEAYSNKMIRGLSSEASPASISNSALPSASFDRNFYKTSNSSSLDHVSIEPAKPRTPSHHSVIDGNKEKRHEECRFGPEDFENKGVRDDHECVVHACIHEQSSSATATKPLKITGSPRLTAPVEVANILDGIEEHLNGLASVLQIAATTFQKAASKTRESDTSVVEDILNGVKNILGEVGLFGAAALQEINRKVDEQSAEIPDISDKNRVSSASGKVWERDGSESQTPAHGTETLPNPQLGLSPGLKTSTIDGKKADFCSEVKSAIFRGSFQPSSTCYVPTGSTPSNPIIVEDDSSSESGSTKKVSFLDEKRFNQLDKPSILDDSSEDADFTARYPPLRSVRRARSTVEHSEKSRMYVPYRPKTELKDTAAHIADFSKPFHPPFCTNYPPSPHVASNNKEQEKPDVSESSQKPLPGAWPDIKNDLMPALPIYAESSGAFFNRMTGRTQLGEQTKNGLHRANTTASSNPASRLNGPFDPGFPYEPTSTPPWLNVGAFRLQKHSASFPHNPQDHGFVHSAQTEKFRNLPKLDTKRSVPEFARPALPRHIDSCSTSSAGASINGNNTTGYAKYESHRGVKHHRSVPHFQPYASPTFPSLHDSRTKFSRPSQFQNAFPRNNFALRSNPNLPAAPMTIPSNAPYTAFPSVVPGAPSFSPIPSTPYAPQLKPSKPPASSISSNISTVQQSPLFPISLTPRKDQRWNNTTQSFESASGSPCLGSTLRWDNDTQCFSSSHTHQTSPVLFSSPALFGQAPNMTTAVSPPSPPPPALPSSTWCFQPEPIDNEFSDALSGTSLEEDNKPDKFDLCVEKLKMCGFGINDDNLKDRLHVYAVAANGDVEEAVEMIEEDRRCSAGLRPELLV